MRRDIYLKVGLILVVQFQSGLTETAPPSFLILRTVFCPTFLETETSFKCQQIQEALQRATFDCNSQVGIIFHLMDAMESPPTYFRTNRLTNAFQEIVDAYG